MSQTSLTSNNSAGAGSSSKLGTAQAELQACESHLAAKERELDELRVSAMRRGLEGRCKAMVECGWAWGEMGKEGLRALEGVQVVGNGVDGAFLTFLARAHFPMRVFPAPSAGTAPPLGLIF